MNTSFFKPNGPLLWSSSSIVLMVMVLTFTLPSLLVATFGFGPGDSEIATKLSSLMSEHEEMMTTYQARFNGRSVFFTPPPTPKPPETPRIEKEKTQQIKKVKLPPTVEPVSKTYTGPSIMGIFGEEAWFVGSGFKGEILRISIGEEKDGIKIISTNPPWSVTVLYDRGEYEVHLFEIRDLGFDKPPAEVPPPPGVTVQMITPDDDRGDQTKPTSDKTQTPNDTSGDSASKSRSGDAEKSDEKTDKTGNESPDSRKKGTRQSTKPTESPDSSESTDFPGTSTD